MTEPMFTFKMHDTVYSKEIKTTDDVDIRQDGQEALRDNFMNVKDIARSMKIKEQTDGVTAYVYGERFKDVLTPEERTAAAKKEGTELFQKAQNKKLILGASKEYNRRLDEFTRSVRKTKGVDVPEGLESDFEEACCLFRLKEKKAGVSIWKDYCGDGQQRYRALDRLVENFVNQDFEFDLSTDEMVAKESLKFVQMKNRTDSFLSLMMKNIEYWSSIDDLAKASVMKKLQQADRLWHFYTLKARLITNDLYSTRLDSEMSYVDYFNDDENTAHRNKEVYTAMVEADEAYLNLKHMEDADRENLVVKEMGDRIGKMDVYHRLATPKEKEITKKGRGFEIMDIFGLPLKVVSFFMRNKRTADHGRHQYGEQKQAFDQKYPKELYNIGIGKTQSYIRGSGFSHLEGSDELEVTPAIKLEDHFTDPVKISIALILENNKTLLLNDEKTETMDEKSTKKLFERFNDAASRYVQIGGIVNADTTEMEMAFLDEMKEVEEKFEESYGEGSDVTNLSKLRRESVKSVMDEIRKNLYGNLKKNTTEQKFNNIVEMQTAVVQSTTITDNMYESNIKDIPLFTHYPNINDIKQSTIGDCYLVGAMTTFVKVAPQAVLDMFQDLGNGDVIVRLYEGYDRKGDRLDTSDKWRDASKLHSGELRPVYVKVRKHYETGDGNANDCVWPQLIEKAYAACGFNMKGEAKVDKKGKLHNMEKELTAGMGYIALSHLTGSFQEKELIARTDSKELRKSKAEGRKVVKTQEFQERMCAGLPYYFTETLFTYIPDSLYGNMDMEVLELYSSTALRAIAIQYGTKLMKVKKILSNKGFPKESYVPIITAIADGMGLRLAADWDEQTSTTMTKLRHDEGRENINMNDLDQRWDTLFDLEAMSGQFVQKIRHNHQSILAGRNVTFDDQRGLDTQEFSDENISALLDNVIALSESVTKENAEQTLPQIQRTVMGTLSFGGDEDFKQKAISERKSVQDKYWSEDKNQIEVRRQAKRMKLGDNEHIPDNALDFMITLQDTISKGGAVVISIYHFITAVDVKLHNHRWYVLIKDPFNVYNMTYERGDNYDVKMHEQGFLDVLNLEGHHYKRHLPDNGDLGKSLAGGFGGLSWWNIEDLAPKLADYTPLLPGHIR